MILAYTILTAVYAVAHFNNHVRVIARATQQREVMKCQYTEPLFVTV